MHLGMGKGLHVVNVCLPVGCLCLHLRGVFFRRAHILARVMLETCLNAA